MEPQPSLNPEGGGEGGGPVLTDGEKVELEQLTGLADAYLTVEQQRRRDALLAKRRAVVEWWAARDAAGEPAA